MIVRFYYCILAGVRFINNVPSGLVYFFVGAKTCQSPKKLTRKCFSAVKMRPIDESRGGHLVG